MATLGLDRASLGNLLTTLTARGRSLLGLSNGARAMSQAELIGLGETLLSRRGEATGVALANTLLAGYSAASEADQLAFLNALADLFGPDMDELNAALATVRDKGTSPDAVSKLLKAAEPRRQELIRRLNLAPGGTASLVRMREALLTHIKDHPALKHVDSDFVHLFASWFNRGFLVLQRIDWTTPANILEKIIRYEQVHAISNWDDLRSRLAPSDRRCYGFFHPQLVDEPLIFVEVALTNAIAPAIQPILADGREPVLARAATTAIFYSISNCQKGLAGVTFGNFLIKQVVEDLAREIPSLKTFVTLSPVPGFRTWLDRERGADAPQGLTREDVETLRLLDTDDWRGDKAKCEAVRRAMLPAAAAYFLRAKNEKGRPLDPVARFHLGNGARLERMNFLGDTSKKGMKQSYGLMVNYLYDLSAIEKNHETYVNLGTVATSSAVSRELRSNLPPPRAVVLAEAG